VEQHGPSSRGSRGNPGLNSDLESVTYRFHDALEGSTPTYTYDPNTLQLAMITDADGNTTSYTYDSMGICS